MQGTGRVESARTIEGDSAESFEARLEFLQAMVDNSSDILTVLDLGGRIVYSNPAGIRVLGYQADELRGSNVFELVHGDDVERVLANFLASFDRSGLTDPQQFRMRHADGSWRSVEAIGNNLLDHPAVEGFVISTRDVTERVAIEQALRDSEERYRRLVERSPQAIAVQKDDNFVYVNPACIELLAATSEVDLVGRAVLDFVHPDEVAVVERRMRALEDGENIPVREERLVRLDGRTIDVEAAGVAITFAGAPAVQLMIRDISDRKRAEAKLAHQGLHDHLTGLPNRTLLLDRLTQALARAARHRGRVAVLFLDLDRFKVVNDSLGHDAGDRLLMVVTERLRGVVRETDTLARFGGDEFVIVVDEATEIGDITALADRIATVLDEPVDEATHRVRVQTSIGIAVSADEDETPEELIRDADAAMYRAKERGRARYEMFDPAMRIRAMGKLQDESALRQALERQELRVFYQPVVAVIDSSLVGMEALVRWQHPERGLLVPSEFLPIAEESGLIVPIGQWVFEQACAQAEAFADQTARPLEMAVNLSSRQLAEPHLVKTIDHMIDEARIDPAHVSLCLEITEDLVLDDPLATIAILTELKTLGVGLAIDDFGTGYSSLAQLRRFPVDMLKIDRSFIAGLDGDPDNQAIVAAIIDLGHALGLKILAEGVETRSEFAVLCQLGCDRAQGFFFARPQPAHQLTYLTQAAGPSTG